LRSRNLRKSQILRFTIPASNKTPTPSAFQGCTPGYWKQSQHFDSSAYAPSNHRERVFDNTDSLGRKTLLQALSFKGESTITVAKQVLLRGRSGVARLSHSGLPALEIQTHFTTSGYAAGLLRMMPGANRHRQLQNLNRKSTLRYVLFALFAALCSYTAKNFHILSDADVKSRLALAAIPTYS
jgi:hypothetical protein